MKYIIGLVMALMFIPACSGEDAELSPPEKCEALVHKTCSLVSRCGGSYIQCQYMMMTDGTRTFTCNDIVAVQNTYDQCMHDLDYVRCTDTHFPISCEKVLLYVN